jgi:hypothetical protein
MIDWQNNQQGQTYNSLVGGGGGTSAAELEALRKQLEQLQAFNAQPAGNPFSSAMSGDKAGTLQPYINRQTQQGSNALYGGLLNYQPQQMQAGDAGGQATPSQVPQGFNIPSAIPQGLLSGGGMGGGMGGMFGKRSWMNRG